MDKYISKIANMTQTEVRVERLALEIAEKTKDSTFQMERHQTELQQHICMLHQSYLDKTYFKETFQVLQESQKLLSEIDVKRF